MDMGYVKKEGETGLSQVTFSLTSKGNDMLPPLSTEEEISARFALTPADGAILKHIATTKDSQSVTPRPGNSNQTVNMRSEL